VKRVPSLVKRKELNAGHVHCGRAFFPLLNLKGDTVTFVQRLETAAINSREMNEHVRAVLLLNEAVPFLLVEPLDGPICHNVNLLSSEFCSKPQVNALTNRHRLAVKDLQKTQIQTVPRNSEAML